MKAAFLDRDGVITNNSQHYYIYKIEDISFVDGIIDNLILLKNEGFQFFIVTNQGGISKKEYTMDDVENTHNFIKSVFTKSGIEIRDIMVCPHHDDIENCLCRKPKPLLIEKLIAQYNINKKESVFIGDSETDMQAASDAGIKGIKVKGNENMYPYIIKLIKA